MLAVQVRRGHGGDEELQPVRVGPGVGHRQQERLVVGQVEVFVLEFRAVNRLAARAGAIGEVTALTHEILDHAVETAASVTQKLAVGLGSALFTRT